LQHRWRKELNGEVFHSHNAKGSVDLLPERTRRKDLGVFMIPKGTLIYEDEEGEQFASFAIKYIGPLNEELAEKILAQVPKDEEGQPIT